MIPFCGFEFVTYLGNINCRVHPVYTLQCCERRNVSIDHKDILVSTLATPFSTQIGDIQSWDCHLVPVT